MTIHDAAMIGNTRAVSLLRTLTQLGTSSSRSEEGQQQARGPPHWRPCLLHHFSPAATSFYKIQSSGPPFLAKQIDGADGGNSRVASGMGAADDGSCRVASGIGAADGGNIRVASGGMDAWLGRGRS